MGCTKKNGAMCILNKDCHNAGDYDQVEGILILEVLVNDTKLYHNFYVMKPKRMVLPIILGQPRQRQYNYRVN